MKQLAMGQYQLAKRYMENHARPLERELFLVRFAGKPIEGALDELTRYRNPDRGYGQALEPDMRSPSSSSLETALALFHLRDLGLDAGHPLVAEAIAYLIETINPERWVCRPTPADINEHPHGPWWNDVDGQLEKTFDDFAVIPRARIVALLHYYADVAASRQWLIELTERAIASIEALPSERLWGDTLAYSLEIADEPSVPESYRNRVSSRILPEIRSLVTLDEEKWSTYCTPPVLVAPRPDSVAAPALREDVRRNLDWLIDRQTERGCWEPNWSWGKAYPDDWEIAKREWCGVVTYEVLSTLRAYNRLTN